MNKLYCELHLPEGVSVPDGPIGAFIFIGDDDKPQSVLVKLTPLPTTNSRERFEAWAVSVGRRIDRLDDGFYGDPQTTAAFIGYQAASAIPQPHSGVAYVPLKPGEAIPEDALFLRRGLLYPMLDTFLPKEIGVPYFPDQYVDPLLRPFTIPQPAPALDALRARIETATRRLLEAFDKCPNCTGSGQDHDGEGWLSEPCPKCLHITEALALLNPREALRSAGKAGAGEWKSFALWPADAGLCCENPTSDTHGSQDAAGAVCKRLERTGFGGDGKIFPVKTWVEQTGAAPESGRDGACSPEAELAAFKQIRKFHADNPLFPWTEDPPQPTPPRDERAEELGNEKFSPLPGHYRLMMCVRETGQEFLAAWGGREEILKGLKREADNNRDVWVICPDGSKILPDQQAAIASRAQEGVCVWTQDKDDAGCVLPACDQSDESGWAFDLAECMKFCPDCGRPKRLNPGPEKQP